MSTLLHLSAGVALLVWATHLVKAAVVRICGPNLRRFIAANVASRPRALLSGLIATLLLQSSTACAVLASSFVSQRLISLPRALVLMLGANVGTALIVAVFSLDLSWLPFALLLVGVPLSHARSRAGQIGHAVLGLGLVTLSLQIISLATRPIAASPEILRLLSVLDGDALLALTIGALLAVVCYSSLAVILICAALAGSGALTLPVGLALVLGANVGGGLSAMLSLMADGAAARRVALGNLLTRLAGALVMLPVIGQTARALSTAGLTAAHSSVAFHLFFNLALSLAGVGLTSLIVRLCEVAFPDEANGPTEERPRFLDPAALSTPSVALSNAAREALRIGDRIGRMLDNMLVVLRTNNLELLETTRRLDDEVDSLYTGIKLYLARLPRKELGGEDGQRWEEILATTIRLEHAGDIIDGILLDAKQKKIARGLMFSEEGMEEIADMQRLLLANLQLAMSVFLHHNTHEAQRLLHEKVRFHDLEQAYFGTHLERLARQSIASLETSSLHLDIVGDLRRVNSLFCTPALAMLEPRGALS